MKFFSQIAAVLPRTRWFSTRQIAAAFSLFAATIGPAAMSMLRAAETASHPNIVLIFADDKYESA